ncbi:MAG: hypothetical protein RLZZ136_1685 [Pseudomonadota bacterium]|jgi:sugar phosphate isomerase/epimerase
MHPRLSINTLSLKPASIGHHIETVARLRARAISLDLLQFEHCNSLAVAAHIRDAGLDVATLTHRAFAFATPADAKAGQDRLKQTIALAQQIGALSIIMTTGPRGDLTWPAAAARFAEAVAACADLAHSAGIQLAIEQTSHLYADASIAHRLSDSLHLVRQAGIAVIIDLFACWFDADIEEAIADAAPLTALVQVSDYVLGDRGLPCRAVPGDGAIPLDRLIPAILKAGFTGYFDLEIIGPRLQAEGEEQGLRRAGAVMGKLLGAANLNL